MTTVIQLVTRKLLDTIIGYVWWLEVEIKSRLSPNKQKSEKCFLLIADRLPPDTPTSGTYRPTSFLQYASENGWSATAISTPYDESSEAGTELLSHLHSEVTIYRPERLIWPWNKVFPSVSDLGGFGWALSLARKAINAKVVSPPTIVLASGPPFRNFIAGHYVARYFSASLVLDYRDEWTQAPHVFVPPSRKLDLYWEKRLLAEAKAVIFTTKSQIANQLTAFPELEEEKCHLIPNGWNTVGFGTKTKQCNQDEKRIKISFIGSLHHGPVSDFLTALSSVNRALPKKPFLRITGFISPRYAEIVEKHKELGLVETSGYIPQSEARKEMQASDILLILSHTPLERYLPGKLFEYIAAGTPILIFGAPGEVSNLVEKLNVGLRVAEDDIEGLGSAILDLAERKRSGSLISPEVKTWLDAHRRDKIAANLFNLFEDIRTSKES
ncbi:MAG: glycosyltransferase [Alphaproteobacteria bacterium]